MPTKRKPKPQKHPEAPQEFGTRLFLVNANRLLEDLSTLLEELGISASFSISKVAATEISTKSKGNGVAYAFAMGEVLSHWYRDLRYLDRMGFPRAVKMSGRSASFQNLVKLALPGASPQKTLTALKKTGAIEISQKGWIRPVRRTLTVFADHDLAIHHTFIALKGIVNTLKHNLISRPTNTEQRFHRIAWSGDLTPEDVSRFQVWINKHGQNFLESADDWMKSKSRPRTSDKRKRPARTSVGVYLDIGAD